MTTRRSLRRLRLLARIGVPLVVVAAILTVGTIVAVQFAGILAKNVALGRELDRTRADVAHLRVREAADRRTVARLADARGALPEIHRTLQLVGPHEELIYLRGAAALAPTPGPDDWRPNP